jgi:hypothetical protein
VLKHPFGYSEPVFTDTSAQQAHEIQHALKLGDVPWCLKDTSLPPPLASLIRSCCNTNPSIRPSMAFVAQSILHLFTGDGILIDSPEQDPGEARSRVQQVLELAETANDQDNTVLVEASDAIFLRSLSEDGDPVASALLGAAIWRDLVAYDFESDSSFISLTPEYQSLGMYPGPIMFLKTHANLEKKGEPTWLCLS